VHDIVRGVILD
jgi:hypothetical protein